MSQDSQTETFEEPEYIDQSVWVPKGAEVVPAASFLNGHAIAIGKRFGIAQISVVDQMLHRGLINDSHHGIVLRLINLFKLATAKQGYATMKLFSNNQGGYDSSDFCPMTVFLEATKGLRPSQLRWIRMLCGVDKATYDMVSRNSDLIKISLELVEMNLQAYDESQQERADDNNRLSR